MEFAFKRNFTDFRDQSTNFEQMNYNSDEIKGSVEEKCFDVISLLSTYVSLSSMSNENKMVNFNFFIKRRHEIQIQVQT